MFSYCFCLKDGANTGINTMHSVGSVRCVLDTGFSTSRTVLPFANPVRLATLNTCFSTAIAVSYIHLRAHETKAQIVCRLLLDKQKKKKRSIRKR